MPSRKRSAVLTGALLAASTTLFTSAGLADDRHHHGHDHDRQKDSYVGAAFGRGLNTVAPPPGNPLNNVILPKWIEVDAGGVVNFAHAGFHHIVIFKPGFRREHLDPFIPQLALSFCRATRPFPYHRSSPAWLTMCITGGSILQEDRPQRRSRAIHRTLRIAASP